MAALVPTYVARMGLLDHEADPTSFSFPIAAADYTAFVADTTTGKVHDVFLALAALTLDAITAELVETEATVVVTPPPQPPASESAVNDAKLLVLYSDNVTLEKYRRSIPARNPAAYNSTRGQVSLAAAGSGGTAQIVAFVTAFNAGVLSEDGNSVTIREIRVSTI